jgi:uncharacterized membrane protein YccC
MPGSESFVSPRLTKYDVIHVVRTTVAAVVSLLVARLFKLPESYWAAITTLLVMQSTLGAAFTVSWHRFVGTAIGAAAGALFATYFGLNAGIFGMGIFILGIICAVLRLDRVAYRFAGITLAITMLSGPHERRMDSGGASLLRSFIGHCGGVGADGDLAGSFRGFQRASQLNPDRLRDFSCEFGAG